MAFHFVCTSCSNRCDKSHSITDACSGVDQIHGDKCQYCPARLRSLRIRSTAGGAAGSTVGATVGTILGGPIGTVIGGVLGFFMSGPLAGVDNALTELDRGVQNVDYSCQRCQNRFCSWCSFK